MCFFKKRRDHFAPYKAVFSVSIETNKNYQENNENHPKLVPSKKYYFDKEPVKYEDIEVFASSIIDSKLQKEFEQYINFPILDIKVKNTYEGSIELLFIVVFGVANGVIRIKELYDSIEFLRDLAEKIFKERFKKEYGDYFSINVNSKIPSDIQHWGKYKNCAFANECPKRDGFFYYLIISNIVLSAIVTALVLGAVIKVYFL
jgi:hypothetical protein